MRQQETDVTSTDLIQRYEVALASQDWTQVEPLLHDEICVTFSSGTFKGKAQVREAFERTFNLIRDEQYAISNLHWAIQREDIAVCLYDFHWRGFIDGKPAAGGGRGTSVLVRDKDDWRIVAEHLGPPAPGNTSA